MTEEYEEYRKVQMEDGLLFQDFVVDVAWKKGIVIAQYSSKAYQYGVGESRNGIEIKHDKKRKETGNLYIEYAEKARPRPGPYADAGIMRGDSWLYAIGDYDILYMFPTKFLLALKDAQNGNRPKYRHVVSETSLGYLLPESDGVKYAATILRPNAGEYVASHVNDLDRLARELHVAAFDNPEQQRLFT